MPPACLAPARRVDKDKLQAPAGRGVPVTCVDVCALPAQGLGGEGSEHLQWIEVD